MESMHECAAFAYLPGGWERNLLLEKFCFSYPWKFLVTYPLLRKRAY
jgi:hypothetical protein